ncbi:MAG: hypothetical protein WBA12_12980 [Catalinimonas sp.]
MLTSTENYLADTLIDQSSARTLKIDLRRGSFLCHREVEQDMLLTWARAEGYRHLEVSADDLLFTSLLNRARTMDFATELVWRGDALCRDAADRLPWEDINHFTWGPTTSAAEKVAAIEKVAEHVSRRDVSWGVDQEVGAQGWSGLLALSDAAHNAGAKWVRLQATYGLPSVEAQWGAYFLADFVHSRYSPHLAVTLNLKPLTKICPPADLQGPLADWLSVIVVDKQGDVLPLSARVASQYRVATLRLKKSLRTSFGRRAKPRVHSLLRRAHERLPEPTEELLLDWEEWVVQCSYRRYETA